MLGMGASAKRLNLLLLPPLLLPPLCARECFVNLGMIQGGEGSCMRSAAAPTHARIRISTTAQKRGQRPVAPRPLRTALPLQTIVSAHAACIVVPA